MAEYPESPWRLEADAHLSVWLVPRGSLPALPATARPALVAGRAVVVTAWFDYLPGGMMAYHELLSCIVVRNGLVPTATITEIWVDSPDSRAGGRELWAIPKEMADLDFAPGAHGTAFTATASTGESWIATAAFSPRPGLPIASPASFAIAQERDGAPLVSPVNATGKPAPASASWNVNPEGPLGYLAGRSPVLSAKLAGATVTFGRRPGSRN